MMPNLRTMTTDQRAMMFDHVVGATWDGPTGRNHLDA